MEHLFFKTTTIYNKIVRIVSRVLKDLLCQTSGSAMAAAAAEDKVSEKKSRVYYFIKREVKKFFSRGCYNNRSLSL